MTTMWGLAAQNTNLAGVCAVFPKPAEDKTLVRINVLRCAARFQKDCHPVDVCLEAEPVKPGLLQFVGGKFLSARAIPVPVFCLPVMDQLVQEHTDAERFVRAPGAHKSDRFRGLVVEPSQLALATGET